LSPITLGYSETSIKATEGEMQMEIATRIVGKCKALDCRGEITLGPATAAIRNAIREAVQDGTPRVILNLAKVSYIDSAGIGELISGYIHVKNQGGDLSLLNLTKKINTLLVIAKLTTVFEIYEDEKSALEGC
jgi:anti-sigma B factor antagonist